METTHLTDQDIANDRLMASPRFRISTASTLTLDNTWKRIVFGGTEILNTNTFPVDKNQTQKKIYWDATNTLIKFTPDTARSYNYTFFYNINAVLPPVDAQLRFVIPSPTPFYFPFSSQGGYIDLESIERATSRQRQLAGTLYTLPDVFTYGLGIEMKISQSILSALSRPILNYAALLIQGK